MNERVKQLLGQAYDEAVPETWTTLSSEQLGRIYDKFAELIVKECAQYMYEHYPHSLYEINYMRKHMGDVDWNKPIKENFGVEK